MEQLNSKKEKKDIAWLVSHCHTQSKREDYVEEMKKSKDLEIDIFGECASSSFEIPRSDGWSGVVKAYPVLSKKYKFYLSFENAKCLDYITEKFFMPLMTGIIPVVLGGLSKKDYL